MSADTDRLIAQARANRDLFDQSLMLALAAALEAAEAQRDRYEKAIKEALLRAGIGPGAAEILRAALAGVAPPEEQPE